MVKVFLWIFLLLSIGYPLWERLHDKNWAFDSSLISNIFPALGLLAFSLLWVHSISGVFEGWLRKHIDFDKFVKVTAIIILVSIIMHPLLLFIRLGFNFGNLFSFYDPTWIWAGIVGWLLLITYDIGKAFYKYDFFARNWRKILLISNVGFLITFFHSINLGSDLQRGPLRYVWIFYGVTAALAIIYTYGVKRFLSKTPPDLHS